MKPTEKNNLIIEGIGVGTGKAGGTLHFFSSKKEQVKNRAPSDVTTEKERYRAAKEEALKQIQALCETAEMRVGKQEAEIFQIHLMLLEDEDFSDSILSAIESGLCAEEAIGTATTQYKQILAALGDPYLSARAADLNDIGDRLTDALTGKSDVGTLPDHPYILVADDLTPSQTLTLPKEHILGFVTFGGTPSSHTSILARAMGIPALVGVGAIRAEFDGSFAILDAAAGTLLLSPDDKTRTAFLQTQERENTLAKEHERYLRTLINKPAVTRSGRRILIYANAGNEAEVTSAIYNGADGIGLLRSEFLYFSYVRYPGEDELFEAYDSLAKKMQGKRLIIRTLDVGADKQIGYFDLPREDNPALGFRAVRLCLAREEIFCNQLRAILRASARGAISLMIPMIVSLDEVLACKRLIEKCKEELSRRGQAFDPKIEFGIMIETPAAAIMAEELAAEVDFFSVGTNDLTQYTLAADRQNPLLSTLVERNREPILRLVEHAAHAIHAHGGWIGVCGEMAADLHLTERFAEMGIDELSVSPPYLLGVRERVIECK